MGTTLLALKSQKQPSTKRGSGHRTNLRLRKKRQARRSKRIVGEESRWSRATFSWTIGSRRWRLTSEADLTWFTIILYVYRHPAIASAANLWAKFLCALHPSLRHNWAARMAELLAPHRGLLVCLEFPLHKPIETGGPPWGLTSEVYEELLGGPMGYFERVLHYQPERTHKVGEGTDWISVWRKR